MNGDDKPFACSEPGCNMRFTNEDHLSFHKKKHDMVLPLGLGHDLKTPLGLFGADQTPTPTKFLKNCEELGIFNELPKNPFDDAFKKAAGNDGLLVNERINELQRQGSTSVSLLHAIDLLGTPTTVGTPKDEAVKKSSIVEGIPGPGSEQAEKTDPLTSPLKRKSSHDDNQAMDLRIVSPSTPTKRIIKIDSTFQASTDEAIDPSGSVSKKSVLVPIVPAQTKSQTNGVIKKSNESNTPEVLKPSTNNQVKAGAQILMQAVLQLPDGQTIPLNLPVNVQTSVASSNSAAQAPAVAAIQPPAVAAIQAPTIAAIQAPTVAAIQAPTVAAVQATPVIQAPSIQITSPAQVTQVVAEASSSSSTPVNKGASLLAKQKLKATLAQNALQSNMKVMSEAVDHVMAKDDGVYILQRPSVESLQQTPASNVITKVTTQAADTSTPSTKRARKSSDDDTEDRRKKFLERNRAAAARCRQKRKSWIVNLEGKAEELQETNKVLQTDINALRNEVAQLKSLLLAHKECPIFIQQQQSGQLNLKTVIPQDDKTQTTKASTSVVALAPKPASPLDMVPTALGTLSVSSSTALSSNTLLPMTTVMLAQESNELQITEMSGFPSEEIVYDTAMIGQEFMDDSHV